MLKDRLEKIKASEGIKWNEFAKRIGYTPPYISALISGSKTNPSDRFYKAVSHEFNVREEWLRNGAGSERKAYQTIEEPSASYGSELASLFPLTTFGDAVDKLRSIYESKNHTFTAAILANLSAFEFSIKLINELNDIKKRLSRVESVLEEHKPPKNTDERRKAWIEIQKYS